MTFKPRHELDERVILLDNGGETLDRYTAIIDGEASSALAMSGHPFHPQGFGMHVSVDLLWVRNALDGDGRDVRISFADAPEQVQKCILQDVEEADA